MKVKTLNYTLTRKRYIRIDGIRYKILGVMRIPGTDDAGTFKLQILD